jgi:peptide/nickel transport system permease protein
MMAFLAALGPFLANQRPIYCHLDGEGHWPIFSKTWGSRHEHKYLQMDGDNQWQALAPTNRWMPPIPFTASTTSSHRGLPPFATVNGQRHWLGTDEQGRDVLAGLITGARSALFTALVTLLVAFLAGGLLGGIAGYFGDDRLRVALANIVLSIFGALVAVFLLFFSNKAQLDGISASLGLGILVLVIGVCWIVSLMLKRLRVGQKSITVPADLLVMRLAEVFESVPVMVLLLSSVAFMQERTTTKVLVVIGLLMWSGTARFLRAELLRVRQMDYIAAVQRLGLPTWRILAFHALPNALRPVLLMFALSASGAILIESSLSFLNLGSSDITEMSWGKMLQTARNNIEYWWVWLPAGGMIGLVSWGLFEWRER